MASINQGKDQGNQANKDQGNKDQGAPASKDQAGAANRGQASMEQDKQREMASKAGKASVDSGLAHEPTPEEAREAARKGVQTAGGSQQGSPQSGKS